MPRLLQSNNNRSVGNRNILDIQHSVVFQVCKELQDGNWTLEREEDQTGPYAFADKTWIAFDDDTSLRIKVLRV